ncbi:unnamed protein product [Clonostachys rosea]|uniref:Beta-xylosidase C-terminal Concanavalin A-like domain-containing protein n=1 Tax=Bionectria ochroleuca TaxID=29856 RepID=A0ABY6TX89_BIOOC|nr:unnamed protein product [Clonostachys rosea]
MTRVYQSSLVALTVSVAAHFVPRWVPEAVAVVDLAVNKGQPQHLVSGVIYGIPDDTDQIPDKFYTEAGLHWFRAGGAQMGAPNRGWSWSEMEQRWESTLSNYRTARKYGGKFQLLLHDLWGTDFTDESRTWPGDNGDWSDYDQFLNVIVQRIIDNDMIPGMHIDIWNEPEWGFWKRPQAQWLDLFGHFDDSVIIQCWANSRLLAPRCLCPQMPPTPGGPTSWLTLQPITQLLTTIPGTILRLSTTPIMTCKIVSLPLEKLREAAGAPKKLININEYLNLGDELNPAATVWHLSRFERYNVPGLRANWRGGDNGSHLRDFLASLLWRDDKSLPYHPNGDWQALKYYATNMTGYRAGTTGSSDRLFDAYATVGQDKVRVLTGVRVKTGTWALTIKNLGAAGLPSSGQMAIQTWGFTYKIPEAELAALTDRGVAMHQYSNDEITIAIYQTEEDWKTAWAFKLNPV